MRRSIGLTLIILALGSAPALASPVSTAQVHVSVRGTAGVIYVSAKSGRHAGCLIDCTYTYATGTRISIRAQPAANVTHFVRWSGACTGKARTCTLTLRKNVRVTATFALGG